MSVSSPSSSQANRSASPTQFRISVRLMVVGLVIMTAFVTSCVAIGLQYYFSRSMAIDNALANYQKTAQTTGAFIEAIEKRAGQVASVVAKYPLSLDTEKESIGVRDLFAQVIRNNNVFYSVYIGFPDGRFYEVINLENSQGVRHGISANAEDRWVVNSVSEVDGKRIRRLDFFDDAFQLRTTRYESSNYDPRSRLWFKDARENTVTKSLPYLFQYTQIAGQTYAIRLPDTGAVLGIDITLQSFSEHLQQQGSDDEIFVYRNSGEILASTIATQEVALPDVQPLVLSEKQRAFIDGLGAVKVSNEMDWLPIDFALAGQPRGYSIDMIRLIAKILGLDIEFINGYSWPELIEKFESGDIQMMQPVFKSSFANSAGKITDPLFNLPYALAVKPGEKKISNIEQLNGKTLAIPAGWGLIGRLQAAYPDIQILKVGSTQAALEAVRVGVADATLDSSIILHYAAAQYFITDLEFQEGFSFASAALPTDFHLIVRPELHELADLINLALQHITSAQRMQLEQKWLAPDNSRISTSFTIVPYAELIDIAKAGSNTNTLHTLELKGEKYFAYVTPLGKDNKNPDYFAVVVPASKIVQESLERISLSMIVSGSCLLLLLPLCWLVANPVVNPIRQLFDKSISVQQRQYAQVHYNPSLIKELDELSHSMLDMAVSIQKHEFEQRELMEAFIKLIAGAIDQKSPYTGGHCERVPKLALMLADAAVVSTAPAFKEFSFASADEYREFRIAAWLHDCGKITVPEHVVDKGSKLEAIYNRIHEVRMRFEVLWRDAEIHYLKSIAGQPEAADQHKAELERQRSQLQSDFAFIAKSNIGGEFFSQADLERLHAIAQISWQRHFDDRLGLSPIEEARFQKGDVSLPVQEYLLADKPEHIIARTGSQEHHARYNIKMDVPEHLYNMGELHNLGIARGTLTPEDRFKINEHMISTIRMLEALPFPPELARVPRYASTHHETMKGTGYPRKLKGDELSIPERILAVADIFEALTAADRPYKKAKPVSVSVDIMHKMVLDDHIDRDVFELFLTSGIYLQYAHQFLAVEQIDDVDIEQYLGPKMTIQ